MDFVKNIGEEPEPALGNQTVNIAFPDHESQRTYIPVVVKAMEDSVWLPIKDGIDEAAREYNITVEYYVSTDEGDYQTQLDAFRHILAHNPQAVCLIPTDQSKLTPYINKLIAADIPLICLDDSMTVNTSSYCKADGASVGADAAVRIAEAINSRGKVAIAASEWNNRLSAEIIESFKTTMEENYPKIELVNVPNNPDVSTEEQCTTFFTSNPSIKAVFGADEQVFESLITSSRPLYTNTGDETELVLAGVGKSAMIKTAVQRGWVMGTYIIDYISWGYNAFTNAFSIYIGGEYEPVSLAEYLWVDSDNFASSQISRLLGY